MKRFHISLRLMLLLVTLVAVFLAGVGTLRQGKRLRRLPLYDRIESLELRRAELQRQLQASKKEEITATIPSSLAEVEAEIARLRNRLSR